MMDAQHTPWPDVADRLRADPGLAFLPFGALEQHGPHLPLGTDTLTATHVAARLAERFGGVLLPAVAYGDTWNNSGYPGTLSLSAETVTAIAVDLGRALAAAGAGGLVVVNGDWGNRTPLYTAMRRLSEVLPALALDYPGMDEAIVRVRESVPAAPGLNHAEEIETSIVLALAPERVRGLPAPVYPEFPSDFGVRPMQLHPFSASGVFGDPVSATAEKGRAILDATVDASVEVLRDFVALVRERRAAASATAPTPDGGATR